MRTINQTPIDYSHKWYVLSAVGMGIFLSTIDGSIVNITLPSLVRAFQTDFPTVQWVVLSYLLTITTLLLSIGRLADITGKKKIYNIGFVVFTMGSGLCGLAPTIFTLIGFRVIQGLGAAMIMALGMAIITEAFPPSERGRALGIGGAVVSIGIVIGPTLGGLILQQFSWRWIFYVNLPVGFIGTFMVWHFVPERRPHGGQRFDLGGAVSLFAALLVLLLGLSLAQRNGFNSIAVISLMVASLIFLAVFFGIERHHPHPMIDLALFQNGLLTLSLSIGFLTFITIAGTLLLMPFYLENVLGYPPQQVGLLLAILPIALGAVAPLSGSLSDRFGTRPLTIAGLGILLLGYGVVSTLNTTTTTLGYILRFLPVGLGMGIFQSPNNSAIMGSAPPDRMGVVSGMLAISRTLGQTSGIAIIGAIWAARVQHHTGQLLPGGATTATPTSQVYGLQDTFLIVLGLIAVAFLLSLINLYQFRQAKKSVKDLA